MTQKIEIELDQLKATDRIKDYSTTLGYGVAQYTVEFDSVKVPNLKAFAVNLKNKYGATDFSKYSDGDTIAVKFVISL